MDDPNAHANGDPDDIKNDPQNTGGDDPVETPVDTDPSKVDDPKKADAEAEAAKQEKSWLDKIQSGEKTLDDMPKNLNWLKERVKTKLSHKETKRENKSEMKETVRSVMAEERAQEEFEILVEDLKGSNVTQEQEAQLREEYEDYLEGVDDPTPQQKLKALKTARKIVGLKDNASQIRDRRAKGMSLPPLGGKNRDTKRPDQESEMEKKLGGDLPDGWES